LHHRRGANIVAFEQVAALSWLMARYFTIYVFCLWMALSYKVPTFIVTSCSGFGGHTLSFFSPVRQSYANSLT
jgi:predicted benzoate:H+ symporter BenE